MSYEVWTYLQNTQCHSVSLVFGLRVIQVLSPSPPLLPSFLLAVQGFLFCLPQTLRAPLIPLPLSSPLNHRAPFQGGLHIYGYQSIRLTNPCDPSWPLRTPGCGQLFSVLSYQTDMPRDYLGISFLCSSVLPWGATVPWEGSAAPRTTVTGQEPEPRAGQNL